ncbi:hypothetical protein H257_03633 [Aphanomyces astaci]|uniref:Uncharacterized protein n=1 Tax=Aphanomyces astaci TaxID=112090 RepID=W4GXK6_APHAT|nr:hypothetical protein H257_03633 [Aphanomyces astaci]ETV84417.1 hypothetical protein H257_03633 [Aphanomyces astaci]|eukprot:XP_009826109.1 hypothetical protein H257_03633 [Aphanomyces astaci]
MGVLASGGLGQERQRVVVRHDKARIIWRGDCVWQRGVWSTDGHIAIDVCKHRSISVVFRVQNAVRLRVHVPTPNDNRRRSVAIHRVGKDISTSARLYMPHMALTSIDKHNVAVAVDSTKQRHRREHAVGPPVAHVHTTASSRHGRDRVGGRIAVEQRNRPPVHGHEGDLPRD